ncbi:hypothetical protein [Streptomyces echinatus]|uniref:hypothetical protein n=1 Tax=Streptomyces echinatus TaxID=67293 RepID=UPI003805B83B
MRGCAPRSHSAAYRAGERGAIHPTSSARHHPSPRLPAVRTEPHPCVTYATAQNIGGRITQCDATAVRIAPTGNRAFVLLDGIGSTKDVRNWTRRTAARLARTAAHRGNAKAGLRTLYEQFAADPDRQDPYLRRYMASDGAHEPHEEGGYDPFTELGDEPLSGAVRSFVDHAVDTARAKLPADEHRYVDNATTLVADLTSRHA